MRAACDSHSSKFLQIPDLAYFIHLGSVNSLIELFLKILRLGTVGFVFDYCMNSGIVLVFFARAIQEVFE